MKLLLYCDEYCYCCNGKHYLENFGVLLLNRYLRVFDFIKYPVRVKYVDSESELGKFCVPIDETKVEVVPIPFGFGANDFIRNFRQIQKSLKNLCKSCDIAILRLPSIYSFNILFKVWGMKLPYATEIVFDCIDGYKSSSRLFEKISWKVMHILQRRACSKAEGVACVTAKYLQKRYHPKKEDSVVSYYSSIELPQSFFYHERLFPANKKFKIVHVAYQVMYNSRKGHNQLMEALQIVRNKGVDAEVVFVGGDYNDGVRLLKNYAKELGVSDSVTFSDFVSQHELRNIMEDADLAVLPTKAEGLPRVVIEAMAMGLPCLSTNVSGNPELLDSDFLLDYTDVEGFADCIVRLFSDKDLYESTSKLNFYRSLQYESFVLQKRRDNFYNALKNKIDKNDII